MSDNNVIEIKQTMNSNITLTPNNEFLEVHFSKSDIYLLIFLISFKPPPRARTPDQRIIENLINNISFN